MCVRVLASIERIFHEKTQKEHELDGLLPAIINSFDVETQSTTPRIHTKKVRENVT